MKTEITIKKEVDIRIMNVKASVRYWEDGELNGTEDIEGKMPCREGDLWCPQIMIDTGQIVNWEQENEASIHYKVCDGFSCELLDQRGDVLIKKNDIYVPDIMCPKDSGYGDYIIMDIDKEGFIKNWKPEFSFIEEED